MGALKQEIVTGFDLELEEKHQDLGKQVVPLKFDEICSYHTVFIIDDEEGARLILERKLKKYFDDLYIFSSVEEAKACLFDNPDLRVDVLISDYYLEGDVGTTMAKVLKDRNQKTTTFLISGDTESVFSDDDIKYIDEVLQKPLCYDLLVENFK